ncbi:Alpha/Beta hydrolase protein [Mycena olivaceomarginata]|nr:Alpha/Beta hydrolase protein [Mycena olivaceomarginata]
MYRVFGGDTCAERSPLCERQRCDTHARFTVVQVYSSINDNTRDVKRSLSTAVFVGSPKSSVAPAVEMGDVVASIAAPAGSVCFPGSVVLRQTSEEKRYLEIGVGDVLEVSKDVTKAHKSFYSDEFFSSLSFSPLELAFMYTAEANEPTEAAEKFKFTPHLGEGLAGKKRPTIFIFRWDPSALPCQTSLASTTPFSSDKPVFSPLAKSTIYSTGYEYTRDGRLLGIRWCHNRPSGVWEIKLPPTTDTADDDSATSLRCVSKKLTPTNLSCRSPRVYYNAEKQAAKLFWLSCASGGPHAGTFSLHVSDLAAPEIKSQVLGDTVWEPRESDGFPGFYLDANLPVSPFIELGGEVFLVFSSTWGSRTTVLLVSTADGTIRNLTPDSDGRLYSWSLLATDGSSRFVCSRSAPTIPHEVVLGEIAPLGEVSWSVIHAPYISSSLRTALSGLTYSVISIPERGRTQTVVVRSSPSKPPLPCIQFIHGGPHGVTTTAFSPNTVFLALEGYTVSSPNYTGSTGFGESSVRALLGNCGTVDVQDCIATVRHLVNLGISVKGKGKQFLIGGKPRGFLDCASSPMCSLPQSSANPVISTDPMSILQRVEHRLSIYSSPQGYPEAADGTRTLPPRRTPAESLRIFSSAPLAYVDAVTAHVLLHIGGGDLRVTPTHGLDYYHALKGNARNKRPEQDIEMHWFEKEGHSLDGVEASRIVSQTSRDWFNKYRN